MAKPTLEGIRVVDIGVVWAMPYAAWLLGSMGAEVIHIDNPHHALSWDRLFRVWLTRKQLKTMLDGANFPNEDHGPHAEKKTGKGMWFDYSQIEAVVPNMGEIFMDCAWNGRDQRTIGNRDPNYLSICRSASRRVILVKLSRPRVLIII